MKISANCNTEWFCQHTACFCHNTATSSSLLGPHNSEMALQDEAEWHQADSEQYEAEGEGDLYEFGQECLDRIALALGGKTMVPLAEQALPQLMTDQRWQQRHAALICLAQIAEGCAKVMLQNKQVTGLVQMCKQVSPTPTPTPTPSPTP